MAESLISVRPLHDRVLVGIYDDGDTTILLGGKKFILLSDTEFSPELKRNQTKDTHVGIRPRWAVVMATTGGQDVKPGDKVFLEFGEWTRAVPVTLDGHDTSLWSIPVDKILGHMDDQFTEAEMAQIERLYPRFQEWQAQTM